MAEVRTITDFSEKAIVIGNKTSELAKRVLECHGEDKAFAK